MKTHKQEKAKSLPELSGFLKVTNLGYSIMEEAREASHKRRIGEIE